MKKNRLLVILALILIGMGVAPLYFGFIPEVLDWKKMKNWQPVEAYLSKADLGFAKSSTYINVSYTYKVDKKSYVGNRLKISSGNQCKPDYCQELSKKQIQKSPITVWVNPQNPSESIIDRELSYLQIFVSVFVTSIFIVLGISLLLIPTTVNKIDITETLTKPWLSNPRWASAIIEPKLRPNLKTRWFMAVFWSVVSTVTFFDQISELSKGHYTKFFVALIFPLIGIGLLMSAICITLERKRFGHTLLTLNPYPGLIGGQVGGFVEIAVSFDQEQKFKIELFCIHCEGRGKKRFQTIEWHDETVVYAERTAQGSRIKFVFNVPGDLPSSSEVSGNSFRWHIKLSADFKGVNLDRLFEVPVFLTK